MKTVLTRNGGKRSIRIFGERLKPILAEAVAKTNTQVLNRIVATNFIYDGGRICGAFGYGIKDSKFYAVRAKAVIVATGGASGIYRPNNPGKPDTSCGTARGMRGQDMPWEYVQERR